MTEWQYKAGQFDVTDKMKEAFTEDGLVIVRGLLSEAETGKISASIIDHGMLSHSYKIPDADGRSPIMMLWRHPGNDVTGLLGRCEKVVTTCEKLLGVEEIYHYHGKAILKEPKVGGKFEWHQDYGYWYAYCLKPDMMAVIVAIDECTQENGGLTFLKGSQKCGRVQHGFTGGQQGADRDRVDWIRTRCDPVKPDLKPGDAVFFHSNVLHCSGPNNSDKRRLLINISYNEAGNPVLPNICPAYTALHKVADTAILDCDNLGNFEGKEFINPADDKLVKAKE